MRRRVVDLLLVMGLAALYAVVARIGLAFDAIAGFASLVWPPTGIALAAVLLLGYRAWPGIFAGAAVANLLAGAPVAAALGIAAGNTAEALAGVYLLRRVRGFSMTLESVRDALALIVFASLASTMISATIGVASLYITGVLTRATIEEAWRAWWIGDMVGALLVAPMILVWSTKPLAKFERTPIERVALGTTVIVVAVSTFFRDARGAPFLATPFHQADLLFIVLLWAAQRFGQRGALNAAFTVSVIAVAGTTMRHGPFALDDLRESLLLLQSFIAIVCATVLVVGATVSERRRNHQELRLAHQEAARANQAKADFLGVMSHELRTPLNAIAGYADLLSAGVYGEMNERQTEAVGGIRRNEREMLALVNDLLSFGKWKREDVPASSEKIRIADAFDAVEPVIEQDIRRKRCVLKRDLEFPMLAVRADPKGLHQILVNLLSNASKYSSEGGMITLGAEREGSNVRIWVRDTGVGMTEEEMRRVFEPFVQANHGTTRRFSGAGLGLTIARDLARRMSGDVILASKEGSGATASVLLPAA